MAQPPTQQYADFGAFVTGVMDGYKAGENDPEAVVKALRMGLILTGIDKETQ